MCRWFCTNRGKKTFSYNTKRIQPTKKKGRKKKVQHPNDIKDKPPFCLAELASLTQSRFSFLSSLQSFNNLFHHLGTPAPLPGSLGSPRLGNLGCSHGRHQLHFHHLESQWLWDSTWHRRSAVPSQSSARSG